MTTKPRTTSDPQGDDTQADIPAAQVPTSGLVELELAYPWTDDDDVEHAPDSTVSVTPERADALIRDGRARPVGTTTEKE